MCPAHEILHAQVHLLRVSRPGCHSKTHSVRVLFRRCCQPRRCRRLQTLHRAKHSTFSGACLSSSRTKPLSRRRRPPALSPSAQSMVSRRAALRAGLSVLGMAARRADQQLLGDQRQPRQASSSTEPGRLLLVLSLLSHVRWSWCLDMRPQCSRERQASLCGSRQTSWIWSAAAAMTAGPACLPPSKPGRVMSSQRG